jgi:hypothetical protein
MVTDKSTGSGNLVKANAIGNVYYASGIQQQQQPIRLPARFILEVMAVCFVKWEAIILQI